MTDPTAIDALLRGIAIGGVAVIGGALAATARSSPVRWVGLAFCAAAIGHVLDNWDVLRPLAVHASLLSWMLSALGPSLFWAFTITLFDDRFDGRLAVVPAAALAIALSSSIPGAPGHWFSLAYNVLSALLMAHALFVVWTGRHGDLVEPRRRLRVPVLAAAGLYVLVIAAAGIGSSLGFGTGPSSLVLSAALALVAVAGAVTLLRADAAILGPAPAQPPPVANKAGITPLDRLALERLATAMTVDKVWRREDISIGSLAALVGLPEHRLRRLINRELGHRNFAAFVNASRIEAAKAELTDPRLAGKTIAAIAYDLGFGSLGPFNRAFKQETGVTPTAWRLGETSPNSENPSRI